MSDETPYSKREIDIILKGQNDNFEKLFEILKEFNVTLKSIESNQTTNAMDIAIIKDTIKDYPEVKSNVAALTNYKWWVIGAVAVFTVIGGSVVLLFESQINSKISEGIETAFDSRFAKVQVINNTN